MRTRLGLAVAAALAVAGIGGMAWAQEGSPPAPGTDPAQPQEDRAAERVIERLGLSGEVAAQVREIYSSARTKRDAADTERDDALKGILTGEQFEQYKQAQSERGRGGRGGPGGGGFGGGPGGPGGPGGGLGRMFGRFLGPVMDNLRSELDLTPEQDAEVTKIMEGAQEKIRARIEELRDGGFQNLDWDAMRKEMETFQDELSGSIRQVLTEDQQKRFDELAEQLRGRMGGFGGPGGPGGGFTPSEGASGGRGRGRRTPEQRIDEAMTALAVGDSEEATLLKSLISKVVNQQETIRTFGDEARTKIEGMQKNTELDEETLDTGLQDLRKKRDELEAELDKLRGELQQVVTFRQEMELILRGILE